MHGRERQCDERFDRGSTVSRASAPAGGRWVVADSECQQTTMDLAIWRNLSGSGQVSTRLQCIYGLQNTNELP